MLVLLPPSEGKTAPAAGAPVDLSALVFDAVLTAKRERLLNVLARLCAGNRARALKALDLSVRQADEVERDAHLCAAPAAPAAEVYTGVLYERLGLPALPHDDVLIASALWGVVAPGDRIPAYRLSIGARLPRVGPLAAYWRPALRKALPDRGLVVDMRSGAYAAAWMPRDTSNVVAVRALTPEGRVVSHMVKATRGDAARTLIAAATPPKTPQDVADLLADNGRTVALTRTRTGWSLDVTEPA